MIERLVECLEALLDLRDPCKVEHRPVDILVTCRLRRDRRGRELREHDWLRPMQTGRLGRQPQ